MQLEDPISAFVDIVPGLLLGVQSMALDVNLLEEEIGWKGEAGGDIRPVKTMVLQVVVMCSPPCLHYTPN